MRRPASHKPISFLGAVEVNPRNFYRLLQTGQAVLLFPGGVREALHGKNEDYQVYWPEKTDFVRVAARFNATIVSSLIDNIHINATLTFVLI